MLFLIFCFNFGYHHMFFLVNTDILPSLYYLQYTTSKFLLGFNKGVN